MNAPLTFWYSPGNGQGFCNNCYEQGAENGSTEVPLSADVYCENCGAHRYEGGELEELDADSEVDSHDCRGHREGQSA